MSGALDHALELRIDLVLALAFLDGTFCLLRKGEFVLYRGHERLEIRGFILSFGTIKAPEIFFDFELLRFFDEDQVEH